VSRNRITLTVRCAKKSSKNFHILFRTEADKGSTFERRTSNLEWVGEIEQPVRIDIGGNRLTEVDLSPLSSCENLEYLSISDNQLETVDLSPLESCKQLRNLDLSHNYLKEIDLSPVAECTNLTYLYLQENMFKKVNVAPLFHLYNLSVAVIQLTHRAPRPKVVIDSPMSNSPPNLNDVVYAYLIERKAGFIPEWLYNKDSEIEYEPRPYRELVREYGWEGVKKHLTAISKSLRVGDDFNTQQILFTALGIPELACYDGSLRDLVKLLPNSGSYDDGIITLQSAIIEILEVQLQQGRSTLYFDVDSLSTTRGSVLIPLVLKQRNQEMEDVTLFDNKGRIDLLPLWITSYGSKILRALKFGRWVSASHLPEIERALTKINHEFTVEKVAYDAGNEKDGLYRAGKVLLSHLQRTIS
jgi:hypothetical protein